MPKFVTITSLAKTWAPNSAAVATSAPNDLAEGSEPRGDVLTGLIGGYAVPRVTSKIPKLLGLPVKHAGGSANEDAATFTRVY